MYIQEGSDDDIFMEEHGTEVGRDGVGSSRRKSKSHVTGTVSKEEYIKQLQEEIDRLQAESGKSSTQDKPTRPRQ